MANKTKLNFLLNLLIFAAFGVTVLTGEILGLMTEYSSPLAFFKLTRSAWIDVHSWAGVGLFIGVALHLALHWKWVSGVARRFLKVAWPIRRNFVLDVLLVAIFLAVTISGLLDWLMFPLGDSVDHSHHSQLGQGTTIVTLVHIALHWKWVVRVARRYAQAVL
ncbi:MAG: DUF4405 domain-containing protein [Chloroflexi bacterium]|nr:DUF4405 domain-containing protein [Chloroflexota bacterium]